MRGHRSPAPLSGILYIYEFFIARRHPPGIICVTIGFCKARERRCKAPSTSLLQWGPDCFPARFTKRHLSNVALGGGGRALRQPSIAPPRQTAAPHPHGIPAGPERQPWASQERGALDPSLPAGRFCPGRRSS